MFTDVLVVGGGIVGAATAWELSGQGIDVTLLEADEIGSGASSRNLGYIWLHTRRPGPELELVTWTRDRLGSLEAELEADIGLRCDGGLIYFDRAEQAPVMAEFVERRNADGVAVQLLDGTEARELAPILPESVLGATYCPLDAQIDPRSYARAFATAAQRRGARIVEAAAVRGLEHAGGRVRRVLTDAGPIHAGTVVLAAGGWTPHLARQLNLDLPIRPMRLQVLRTRPMAPRLRHLLYGPAAVKQYSLFQELRTFRPEAFSSAAEERHGLALLEAACQQADGSYLLGCAMDYPGFDWQPTLAGIGVIVDGLLAALPELRSARFDQAWAGILPYTPDNLPLIGRAPGFDDVYVAAGHVFGNGAGPATGRIIADLICGREPAVDPEPFRLDRPALAAVAEESVW